MTGNEVNSVEMAGDVLMTVAASGVISDPVVAEIMRAHARALYVIADRNRGLSP